MKPVLQISAVLPAHDEVDNLAAVVEECTKVFHDLGLEFEIIIVDDGSTDGTAALADKLKAADHRLRAIHHPQNQGYGAALRSGFAAAEYPYIFFTDSDGQFEIKEVEKLIPRLDQSDMVVGFRGRRQDPLHRRIYGSLFSAAIRIMFKVKARDVNCAFKLFKKSIIDQVELTSPGALINAELLAIAAAKGIQPIEIPVSHKPRLRGRQSGGSRRVIFRAVTELARLKRRY